MTNPMIRIHNVETDEIIDREMNAEELEQHKKYLAEIDQKEKDVKAAVLSKEALLTKLGITAEEAELLLSPKSTVIDNV
jgi:hypothetical protein